MKNEAKFKELIRVNGAKMQRNPFVDRLIKANTGKSIAQWMKEIEKEKEE